MLVVKIGLRNLTRHKRRTLLTAFLISLAVFVYIFTDSLIIGTENLTYSNLISLETGHFQIAKPEYWKERNDLPLDNLFKLSPLLKEKIREISGFSSMAELVRFSAGLNNGIDELPVIAVGINPSQYTDVFSINNYLVEGSMFKEDSNNTVLGKKLATLMELAEGDFITLVTRTAGGTFNTIDVEISGLVITPNPNINENIVLLPLEIVQKNLNIDDKVTQVVVHLDRDKENVPNIVEVLNGKLNESTQSVRAYSWMDMSRDVIAMNRTERAQYLAIVAIVLILAAVGIINTTLLASLERIDEIGMMKALGMKEGEIIYSFMVEAAAIGIIGGLIGWILGAIGVYYLTEVGISFGELIGEDMSFGLPITERIYGSWSYSAFIFIFLFSVLVATLSSVLPACWAARKDPVEAIYHH